MSDNHPGPWEWRDFFTGHEDGAEADFDVGWELVDANGKHVLTEFGPGEASPGVAKGAKELIRAAPEMEALLRKHEWLTRDQFTYACPECVGVDGPIEPTPSLMEPRTAIVRASDDGKKCRRRIHRPGCAINAILDALDAARKVGE
jgi:hypothetical protein